MNVTRKGRKREENPGTPGWLVSFTDMVTLLLAFFVMLQSLAKKQDPELFFIGQGSFKRAIAGLGIPNLFFGKDCRAELDYQKRKYPTEEEKKKRPNTRVLDAEADRIRKLFSELKRIIDTSSSDLSERPVNAFVPELRFRPGSWELDESATKSIENLAREFNQNLDPSTSQIYVIGLAPDAVSARQRWLFSARRALSVSEYLSSRLRRGRAGRAWRVHAWGTGGNGEWCKSFGLMGQESHVVILIMGEKE